MANIETTGRYVQGRLDLTFTQNVLRIAVREDEALFGTINTANFGFTSFSLRGEGLDTESGTVQQVRWLEGPTEHFNIEGISVPFNGSAIDFLNDPEFERIAFGGDDTFTTGSFNDLIRTFDGNDLVNANAGNDVVSGGNGDDTLIGASGSDNLFGDAGNDFLRGGRDSDLLGGGTGRDTIQGAKGADVVFGGQGRDLIRLGSDDDAAFGGGGKDTIFAARGDDTVNGGGGDDVITGGLGDDSLTGGGGADIFVFRNVTDDDVITDFSGADGDQINLRAFGYDGFNDLAADDGIISVDGNAVITLEAGTITLQGVDEFSLSEDDFIF